MSVTTRLVVGPHPFKVISRFSVTVAVAFNAVKYFFRRTWTILESIAFDRIAAKKKSVTIFYLVYGVTVRR